MVLKGQQYLAVSHIKKKGGIFERANEKGKLDLFDTDPLILGNLLVNEALINILLLIRI